MSDTIIPITDEMVEAGSLVAAWRQRADELERATEYGDSWDPDASEDRGKLEAFRICASELEAALAVGGRE